MTEQELAALFDHTYLNAAAKSEDFDRIIEEALAIHPACVAVNPEAIIYMRDKLKPEGIRFTTSAGFPLGANTIDVKVYEAKANIEIGADEIDYVLNISRVKNHDYSFIDEEMQKMEETVHGLGKVIKVILETCYLDEDEIKEVCKLAVKNHLDYVKTSTGLAKGENTGARVEIVKLMKDVVGNDVKVKASGGIRDWPTCKAMIDAGAQRIGTSSSLQILEQFRKENG